MQRWKKYPCRLLELSVWLVVFCDCALAQEAEPPARLSLSQAVEQALADNPGLRAAGFDVDIAQAEREAGSLRPPYSVSAELENFFGTDPVNGVSDAETTVQVSRVLERGNKQQLRVAAGDARVELARSEQDRARLELISAVTRRFVELLVIQEERALAMNAIAIASNTRDLVARRAEAGSGSEADLASADIALERARLEFRRHDSEHAGARIALAALWGGSGNAFDEVAGDLLGLPALPALGVVEDRIAANPDLLRLVDERRILEAEQQLIQAEQKRDLELSLGVRHLGETDAAALVFGVGLPIGSARRAEPGVREAGARLAQLPATLEQRRRAVRSAVQQLYRQLEFAGFEYSSLEHEILPRAKDAVELYQQGFEIGSYSLLELSQAQTDLLNVRHEIIDVAARYHLALVALEQLLGDTVTGGI